MLWSNGESSNIAGSDDKKFNFSSFFKIVFANCIFNSCCFAIVIVLGNKTKCFDCTIVFKKEILYVYFERI